MKLAYEQTSIDNVSSLRESNEIGQDFVEVLIRTVLKTLQI